MSFLGLQSVIILLGFSFFAYFSWRKTEYGIYLLIFFLPSYLLRFKIFGIPTTALEIGIYILFFIWLVQNDRLFFNGRIKKYLGELKKSEKPLFWGIFLLTGGTLLSTVFSSDIRTSAGIFKGWFLDPFLFFLIFTSVFKTAEQKINALVFLSFSGAALALLGLICWLFPYFGGVSYDGRLHAIYSSPNQLAMYLAPALIIALWQLLGSSKGFYFENNSLKSKIFWLLCLFVIIAAFYFTYSYAAWLAVMVAVFLMAYLVDRFTKLEMPYFKNKTSYITLAIIFFVLILAQAGTAKFENLKNLSYRSSFNSRLMIWRAALMIGRDNPVAGIGPGNFQKYYLDYRSRALGAEPYLEWAVPEPHNVFLAFWLESSVIGLAGFLLILSWFFKKAEKIFKKTRQGRDGHSIAVVLCVLMAYVVFHGFFDTTYWKNDLSVMFWLILGLMALEKE